MDQHRYICVLLCNYTKVDTERSIIKTQSALKYNNLTSFCVELGLDRWTVALTMLVYMSINFVSLIAGPGYGTFDRCYRKIKLLKS